MLARRRTFFFPVAIAAILLLGRPSWNSYAIGLALIVTGEAIRVWAAGYIRKCVEITISGPFGWMRNPLYAGSFLITLGYCFMADRPTVTIVVMAFFCIFHGAAILSEERYLTRLFGNEFLEYCKSAPRVFPRPPRRRGTERFALDMVLANHEQISALCAAAVASVFALRIVLG